MSPPNRVSKKKWKKIMDTQAKHCITFSSFYFTVSIQLQESPNTVTDQRLFVTVPK